MNDEQQENDDEYIQEPVPDTGVHIAKAKLWIEGRSFNEVLDMVEPEVLAWWMGFLHGD